MIITEKSNYRDRRFIAGAGATEAEVEGNKTEAQDDGICGQENLLPFDGDDDKAIQKLLGWG